MSHPASHTGPGQDRKVADAPPGNWVDRHAPPALRPFLRLMRADRPIGAYLLMFPGWWAIALAAPQTGRSWPDPWLLAAFALGAFVMRGAGCTFNDIVDRDIDAKVARTASRPLPSGAVSLFGAWVFLGLLCAVGLAILLTLNSFAIVLGAASLLLVAAYPFMKRLTWWPQVWLGLTINWGALLGWAAATGALAPAPALLYAAGILWTAGYDTIYGHQDREDDVLIGVKSSSLRLGRRTRPVVAGLYALTMVCLAAAGALAGLHWIYYAGLAGAAAHLAWQIRALDIDSPAQCLKVFRSNRDFAAIVFAAAVVGAALTGGA
jgi:4-hydroxybenzoate polyprenyltransferase